MAASPYDRRKKNYVAQLDDVRLNAQNRFRTANSVARKMDPEAQVANRVKNMMRGGRPNVSAPRPTPAPAAPSSAPNIRLNDTNNARAGQAFRTIKDSRGRTVHQYENGQKVVLPDAEQQVESRIKKMLAKRYGRR